MQTLRDAAFLFLAKAREELEQGLMQNNAVLIRDAAEKAWNAVVQATDHFMRSHGRAALPGRDAHRDRRDFLVGVGRRDLAEKYTFFAERLHGDVFYAGAIPPATELRQYMDEVDDYIRRTSSA
ncbi:MAG TPA: hypothetical protein VGR51_09550 [Thermoplasmata archaeon]|nr:hypothetical protein [Thermoplasmata archaeon]